MCVPVHMHVCCVEIYGWGSGDADAVLTILLLGQMEYRKVGRGGKLSCMQHWPSAYHKGPRLASTAD